MDTSGTHTILVFCLRKRLKSLDHRKGQVMAYMYILECADRLYYDSSTCDLERRLKEHGDGEGAGYTKARLPREACLLRGASEYQSIRVLKRLFCEKSKCKIGARKSVRL